MSAGVDSEAPTVVAAAAPSKRRVDPAVGVGLVLLGCLLSFYVVGLFLIPVGAWLWKRSLVA